MAVIDRGLDEKRVNSWTRLTGIALIMLMAIASIAMIADQAPVDEQDESSPVRSVALTPHGTIFIGNDAGFTNASGVTRGSGTETDPFIISEWSINASSYYGIYISGTTKHFVIRDCLIYDGKLPIGYHGILLWTVQNGTVTNNTLLNNYYGMSVINFGNITITENNCSDGNAGIYARGDGHWGYNLSIENNICSHSDNWGMLIDTVFDSRIANNTCEYNGQHGMDIEVSSYVSVDNNTCMYNSRSGILLYDESQNCTVINNTCESNGEYGIYLSWSYNNTVDRNIASHNDLMGIFLQSSSDHNNITNNECNDNVHGTMYYRGISLEASNFNRIYNNTVLGNYDGIAMMDSDGNDVLNNTVSSNTHYGIVLSWDYNNDNEITGNLVEDNTDYGIIIVWGHNNRVWNNTITDNNGAGAVYDVLHIQGYDGDSGNFWNTSGTPHGYGNNWSDLRAPDSDWDGIVDWSYNMSFGVKDYYPLTVPGTPIPEPAVLILIGLMVSVFFVSNHIRKKKQ